MGGAYREVEFDVLGCKQRTISNASIKMEDGFVLVEVENFGLELI